MTQSQKSPQEVQKDLYKLTKNKDLQVWKICSVEGKIITEYGKLGGKLQRAEVICEPKNVGRANATTAQEQAISEALSQIKTKKDKGYCDTEQEALTKVIYRPMLAHDFKKKQSYIGYPCSIQPKLDGVRCLIRYDNGQLKAFSRGGPEYTNLDHILDAASNLPKEVFNKDTILDGEVYIYGQDIQEINRLVKKKRPETSDLEFWCYDILDLNNKNSIWKNRKDNLLALKEYECDTIKVVETQECQSRSDIDLWYKSYMASMYEGAIIRGYPGRYILNQRSSYLLKLKEFQDEDYEIVGYTNGKGKYSDCVVWTCQTKQGERFNVVPKGSLESKRATLKRADDYIGRVLKVKFFDKTQDDIPRFPVGLSIRLPEDK